MNLTYDALLVVFDYCDYVQLHVLYCTCKNLHDTIDFYFRTYLKKQITNDIKEDLDEDEEGTKTFTKYPLYVVRTLSIPGLILYFPLIYPGIKVREAGTGRWLNDLYINPTFPLLEWYGNKNIKCAIELECNSKHRTGMALQKLLIYYNGKSDEYLYDIIAYLSRNDLIPAFDRTPYQLLNSKDELFCFLVCSGRVKLLEKAIQNKDAVAPADTADRFEGDIQRMKNYFVDTAILSRNVQMVDYVMRAFYIVDYKDLPINNPKRWLEQANRNMEITLDKSQIIKSFVMSDDIVTYIKNISIYVKNQQDSEDTGVTLRDLKKG
ncbi:MAG TPA: hypothetical protein VKR58_10470, partial [Aquella sp.]|nr:hypothetical protein [Aquella sp.]